MKDIFYKKILYRATYRGTQEADLILKGFVLHSFNFLSEQEILDLDILLQHDDEDIFRWLEKNEDIPPTLQSSLLERLRSFLYSMKY